MKIMVKERINKSIIGTEIYLGEFNTIAESKKYWTQGDSYLRSLVKSKRIIFEEIIDF
jgi:hypothetical protein